MKPQGLLATLGFGLAVVVLYLYAGRAQDWSGQLAVVLTAMVAWWLESQAVRRRPVDFSSGFVFYLMLALSGDAVGASLVMVAGYCVREVANRPNTSDLLWNIPVIAGLAVAQSGGNWPQDSLGRILVSVMVTGFAGLLMEFGSRFVAQRLDGSPDSVSAARVEARQRALRRLLLLYAPAAALLPPKQVWMMTMVAPLCWALQRSAENIGFRVHAQEASALKHRFQESEQLLEKSQSRLAKVSERQEILEEMTGIFARPLTPTQAFKELSRVTAEVVEYRSVVLFRMGQAGLRPSFQSSPERLAADHHRHEPLMEKAWLHDRAYRGSAAAQPAERLLKQESQLVAIPLKPAGVLYFGRDSEPFSKAEASRLFFVVKRAAPALLRAEKDEATQQAFAEQTQVSEQLREKVALTSRLLDGAQQILAAGRPEQIYLALENLLRHAVPHQFGVVLVGDELAKAQHWGQLEVSKEALQTLASLVRTDGSPLYLKDVTTSRLAAPASGVDSILAVPLFGEQQFLGALILGAQGRQAFTQEQHDFVYTCACLAGSGLTSLGLFSRLQSAHQQVVQASKLSAIGRLAATVAHELNTPLAAIGLALEAVALRPEKAGEKLSRASNALERAREIVSGLLQHARHSGSERSLLAPQEVIKGALELVGPQLEKRQLKIETECGNSCDRILANMTDLQQVLINLMLNAADASRAGSRVLVFARQRGGTTLELGVQDWGAGIAPEHQKQLFDPFFTTKDSGLGTGLGLSVCRQLAERHQGQLGFVTTPGEGSVFTASFPARQPGSEAISF